MRRYRLSHITRYEYEMPVGYAQHMARLRPRSLPYQRVLSSQLALTPVATGGRRARDYFGNQTDFIELSATHELLEVRATSVLEVEPRAEISNLHLCTLSWEEAAARVRDDPELLDAREYCFDSPLARAHVSLGDYAREVFVPGRNFTEALLEFNQKINSEFTYEPGVTEVTTPLAQVLRERRGVCQDFAHLAVAALRSLGLPARYVSGYLETSPPAGQPRLVGADASHAWASAYVPDVGWVDFDPTNAVLPSERHLTLGWGRDFSDATPFKGVIVGGGRHTLSVAVDVMHETGEKPLPPPRPSTFSVNPAALSVNPPPLSVK
jgi:transglutaminase-like putative cysteine protease